MPDSAIRPDALGSFRRNGGANSAGAWPSWRHKQWTPRGRECADSLDRGRGGNAGQLQVRRALRAEGVTFGKLPVGCPAVTADQEGLAIQEACRIRRDYTI
jgi:hypothetical protein